MDRRMFFKKISNKVAEATVHTADLYVNRKATHWIRPPYALDELDFLLSCTRCDKCIDACPHNVIFRLPVRLGAQVAGTPAMDLLNKGCHLCEDWPCVNACEPGALKFPEIDEDGAIPSPAIAYAEINKQNCLPFSGPECGACESSCPVPGALKWNMTKPYIDQDLCTGCGMCREFCIVEPKAVTIKSIQRRVASFDQPVHDNVSQGDV